MSASGANDVPRLAEGGVYRKLGVVPILNARSNSTVFGGSAPSAVVRAAMDEAGRGWVDMAELMRKTGDYVAGLLGCETAHPTAGCASAIILSSAIAMTGDDTARMARLPNTTGRRNRILIQRQHRYWVQPCFTFAGSRLVPVGRDDGCTAEELEAAIDQDTVAIAHPYSHPAGYLFPPRTGDLPLEDVVAVGRRHDLPVIVDAAAQVYPLDHFRWIAQAADLVCFGGKYFGSSHSTGLVAGRRRYVDPLRKLDFCGSIDNDDIPTGGGYAFGRGMKLDRQQIVALAVALDVWFNTDHQARLAEYHRRMEVIREQLADIPHVSTAPVPYDNYQLVRLFITLGEEFPATAEQIADDLDQGSPRILVGVEGDRSVFVGPHVLSEGEERIVAGQLRSVLRSRLHG